MYYVNSDHRRKLGRRGQGRMVDLLSEQYDIVVRYQGGNNAGHTVINEKANLS